AASLGLLAGLILGFLLGWGRPWQVIVARDHGSAEDWLEEASLVEDSSSRTSAAQDISRASTAPLLPLSFRGIAERTFPSVVFIALRYPNRNRISEASGFVVERGVVATNFHVIDGTVSGDVNLVGNEDKHPIEGVVAADPQRDLALLSVPGLDARPLPIEGGDQVSVGDKIFVVGNPNGLEGTFSDGLVSGKRSFKDFELLQITAPISSGSSGGPVLDVKGRVVGIAKGSWEKGQNLNFAIPVPVIRQLLADRGEMLQFAKVTRPRYPARKPAPAPIEELPADGPGGFFAKVRDFLPF
ncbi:MAG: S1C family serine protease, partial [Candidatus Binatia bacterium]